MPIRYRADSGLGCTIAIWDGDITAQDAHQHLLQLASDPDWPPGSLHLADLTTVGNITMPDAELVELLFEGSNLAGAIRIAVVVREHFISYKVDTRYEPAMNQMQAETFTDLAGACAYLDLDLNDVASIVEQLRGRPESSS
jgi:hypothetical protein